MVRRQQGHRHQKECLVQSLCKSTSLFTNVQMHITKAFSRLQTSNTTKADLRSSNKNSKSQRSTSSEATSTVNKTNAVRPIEPMKDLNILKELNRLQEKVNIKYDTNPFTNHA